MCDEMAGDTDAAGAATHSLGIKITADHNPAAIPAQTSV
jgi:hypothetical protein